MSKPNEELCDALVYDFLVENGHVKTAEKLLNERKNCTSVPASVKGKLKISQIISKNFPLKPLSNTFEIIDKKSDSTMNFVMR